MDRLGGPTDDGVNGPQTDTNPGGFVETGGPNGGSGM